MSAKKIAIIATCVIGVIAVALVLLMPEDSPVATVVEVAATVPCLWYVFCGKKYDEKHRNDK